MKVYRQSGTVTKYVTFYVVASDHSEARQKFSDADLAYEEEGEVYDVDMGDDVVEVGIDDLPRRGADAIMDEINSKP